MRTYVVFHMVFFVLGQVIAQQDTTWFDQDWEETTKDSAAFYRPTPQPKGNGFSLVDYYISGAMQMEGISLSKDEEVFEGVVKWYHENGQLKQKATYETGVLHGEFVDYYNGEPYATAQYTNGKVSEGLILTFNQDYQCYRLLEYQDGKAVREKLFLEMPEKGMIIDSQIKKGDEKNLLRVSYYDGKGNALGEIEMNADDVQDPSVYDGVQINYYYAPIKQKSAMVYDKGALQEGTVWYASGEVREKITVENDTIHRVYFDEDGKALGELTSTEGEGQGWYSSLGGPVEGILIKFSESYFHDKPTILYKEQYRKGSLVEREDFYENGEIQLRSVYGEDGLAKTISYNKEGQVTHQLIYKDGEPFEGSFYDSNKNEAFTYVQGELTKKSSLYEDGSNFESREGNKSVFYDQKGEVIGELTYKPNKYGDNVPYNGTLFQLNYKGRLYMEEDYQEGIRTRHAYYSYSSNKDKMIKESETFYDGKGKKARYKYYYKSGGLREDIIYANGYEEKSTTVYDEKGNILAEMTYLPDRHGTEYTFFRDRDDVQYIKKYNEDGRLIYEKRYGEDYSEKDRHGNYLIFLEEEIDYDGEAHFYDLHGEVLAEATYRDAEPWEGVVKDGTAYEYRLTPYAAGEKHGEEKRILHSGGSAPIVIERTNYVNGSRHGKHTTYNRNGGLESEENYSDGLLDGECVYYNEEGAVRNRIVYKGGKPMDGLVISYYASYQKPLSTKRSFYKEGTLYKIEKWTEDKLSQQIMIDGNQINAAIYDEQGHEKAKFNVVDAENKTGEVTYTNTNSNNQKVVERGEFKDGLPLSGSFYLHEFTVGYQSIKQDEAIAKIKLEVTDDEYSISALDEDGTVVFSVIEKKGLETSYFLEKILDPYSFYYNVMPEF
ncbi:toxin-antitoxin system YwqK family antitoxin [Echinicola rosea]|uniref:Antitoxin component YwqK of the YwqJK toxin-antitoxin module n=1 Tax=Echinicola rosea TaxID=1807691 RepID=A0ABQ1V3D2_9BACT|nr:hypothetical protein [Echinicola rosea]GGF36989.1 hypothetical protein GCM10011339_26890 [Echinicola rosea]